MVAKIKKSKTKPSIKAVKKSTKLKKTTNKLAKKLNTITKSTTKSIKNRSSDKGKAKTKAATKATVKPKELTKNKAKATTNKVTSISSIKSKKNLNKTKNIASKNVNKKKASITKPIGLNLQDQHFADQQYFNADFLSGPTKFQPYEIDNSEDYMSEQQLLHFANILEAWKQELMLEVDHTITEMKEADVLADPNDRATQEETFNLELRTRDRERKLIKKIESALNKINEQKYGYCDSCGVEIGIRRLEARPTATLCIECKTLAEIREKRS